MRFFVIVFAAALSLGSATLTFGFEESRFSAVPGALRSPEPQQGRVVGLCDVLWSPEQRVAPMVCPGGFRPASPVSVPG